MRDANDVIINELESTIMNEAVIARTVAMVRERIESSAPTAGAREALSAEAAAVEGRIKNLVNFLASGVQSKAISNELRELESKLLAIEGQLAACNNRPDISLATNLDAKVAAKIRDWRAVLGGNVAATRLLLKKLLVGPIVMTALPGKAGYRFDGKIKLDGCWRSVVQ